MTITGFAMPMTAYGAEEAEPAVQTEAQEQEAVVEEEPAQTEEQEETTEPVNEEQEEVTEEETITVSTEDLEATEEDTEENVVLMMAAAPAPTTSLTATATAANLVPTDLKAVSASYHSIKLTWKSVSGVSRYKVYVSSDKKNWEKYATVSKTTCTVKNLATKRTRYFKVESVTDKANAKTVSKIVKAKALMETPALKGKLAADKMTATLSWAKVPGAAGYRVYKYDAATKTYKKIKTITDGSKLTCKVTMKAGIKNNYKVRAYRMSEGSKVFSDESKRVSFDMTKEDATTLKFKAGSTTLSSAKRTSSTSGTLTWKKVSGASGYSVYKYSSSKKDYVFVKNVKGAGTLKTNVKLSANKQGTYKVRAYKDYRGRRIRNSYSNSKQVAKMSRGERAVATGKSKLGCPYVWGACGPNAFDCSGFVMWVMRQHGVYLPHNAAGQYYALSSKNIGTNWHNAKAGDIVFYSYGGPGSSHHVGIYVGGGKVMHASSSHGRVVITSITYSNGHVAAICRP